MQKKCLTDPMGMIIPVKYVKAYDRRRDQIARRIAAEFQAEEARLIALKERTLAAVESLRQAAAEAAGMKGLGGKEGYIQFRSFDGWITIRVDNAKRTEFDERLGLAQQLIMEAVRELAKDVTSADLVEIATRAFQPRKSGTLDMQRIRDLKSYNVSHPKWKQAIAIINECERCVGHKRYIRVTVRKDLASEPKPITLDIAAL